MRKPRQWTSRERAASLAFVTLTLLAAGASAQLAPASPAGSTTAAASGMPAASGAPGAPAASGVPAASGAPTGTLPSTGSRRGEVALPVEEYKLSNGLRVILAPDEALPNVAVYIQYAVGGRDDPPGLAGIAHLVEHLMFERSAHVPAGDLQKLFADAGATGLNGSTSFDVTTYYELVPPEQLELALWLESDRMGYFLPALDQAALEQERVTVTTEMRTRYYDRPAGNMLFFIQDATFPSWHPYHTTPIGDYDELQKISLADVKAFAATWYGPDNACLVLAGRFQRERAVALVERYFASLPSRPPPKRPELPALVVKGPTRLKVKANTGQEMATLTWITPAYGAPGDNTLDWVADILARRLEERLVEERIAAGVDATQRSMAMGSVFQIDVAAVEDGKSAGDLVKMIDEEIVALASVGPSEEEIERITVRLPHLEVLGLESAMSRAGKLALAASLGPLAAPFDWTPSKTRKVTAEDVRAATGRYLSPSKRAGVVMLEPNWASPRWGKVVDREEP